MTHFFYQMDASEALYAQIYDKSGQDFKLSFSKVISSETKEIESVIVKVSWPEFGLGFEDLVRSADECGWLVGFYGCILTKSMFYLESLKLGSLSNITLVYPWCDKRLSDFLIKTLIHVSKSMNQDKPSVGFSMCLKNPPLVEGEHQIIWEAEGFSYEPLFNTVRWGKDLLKLEESVFENLGSIQVDINLKSFLSFCQNVDVAIIAPELDVIKRDWLLKNGCSLFIKNDVLVG